MPREIVLALSFRPQQRAQRGMLAWDLGLVAAGSLLIALGARISVPLLWTSVPITGQTLAVMLVGALLGSTRGTLAVVAYIAEGAAGIPVGANGAAGVAWLVGPTGGYLAGFVAAAFVIGSLAERGWDRTPWWAAAAMTLGTIAIFACGLTWLARFPQPAGLLQAGLIPFLPGAIAKIVLASALLPAGWKLLSWLDRANTDRS